MNIPIGHQVIMPYLMLNGATGFAGFMQRVFDARVTFSRLREDSDVVMHSELQVSGATIMFCDATDQWPVQTANMFIYVPDADSTYAAAIEAGSESIMPPADQNYGRACGVKDPYGNVWWITSIPG